MKNVYSILGYSAVVFPFSFSLEYPKEGVVDLTDLKRRNLIFLDFNESDYSYRNLTLFDHDFYPGLVEHKVIEQDGMLRTTTIGVGTGKFPKLNKAIGYFFLRTHTNTARLYRQMYGPHRRFFRDEY